MTSDKPETKKLLAAAALLVILWGTYAGLVWYASTNSWAPSNIPLGSTAGFLVFLGFIGLFIVFVLISWFIIAVLVRPSMKSD